MSAPASMDMPAWLPDLLAHYAHPSCPTIKVALARYSARLPDPKQAPAYWEARRAVRDFTQLFDGSNSRGDVCHG